MKNIINDLLEITYLLSKANILADNFKEIKVSSAIENDIKLLARKLTISALTPIWQMLLKAVNEINLSPNQFQALEMALIRICHLSSSYNLNKIVAEVKKSIVSTNQEQQKYFCKPQKTSLCPLQLAQRTK